MAAFPLAWLSLIYLFALRAFIHLGRWPEAYQPDPQDLGFAFHHTAVWYALFALPVTSVVALVLAAILWQSGSRSQAVAATVALVVSLAVFLLLGAIDPGGIWNWFAD